MKIIQITNFTFNRSKLEFLFPNTSLVFYKLFFLPNIASLSLSADQTLIN